MANSYVEVQEPTIVTTRLASQAFVRDAVTVEREEVIQADPTDPNALARVVNTSPGATDYGAVTRTPGGAPTDGTLAAAVGAAALSAGLACRWLIAQADPDNVADCFIGDSANQRFQLVPGQGVGLPVSNVGLVFGRMASGTGSINWVAFA